MNMNLSALIDLLAALVTLCYIATLVFSLYEETEESQWEIQTKRSLLGQQVARR